MDFEPMCPGFESREAHDFFIFDFFLFILSIFFVIIKFANLTLLSLLSFSYFITPNDAEASSAFSPLIKL